MRRISKRMCEASYISVAGGFKKCEHDAESKRCLASLRTFACSKQATRVVSAEVVTDAAPAATGAAGPAAGVFATTLLGAAIFVYRKRARRLASDQRGTCSRGDTATNPPMPPRKSLVEVVTAKAVGSHQQQHALTSKELGVAAKKSSIVELEIRDSPQPHAPPRACELPV